MPHLDRLLWPDNRLESWPGGLSNEYQEGAEDHPLAEALEEVEGPVRFVILGLHLVGLYYIIKSNVTLLSINSPTWSALIFLNTFLAV